MWTSTSCGELVAGQVPVVIPSDATVHDACELLAAHSILSAPVRSADGTGYAGVCHIRVRPDGAFNANGGTPPSITMQYEVVLF